MVSKTYVFGTILFQSVPFTPNLVCKRTIDLWRNSSRGNSAINFPTKWTQSSDSYLYFLGSFLCSRDTTDSLAQVCIHYAYILRLSVPECHSWALLFIHQSNDAIRDCICCRNKCFVCRLFMAAQKNEPDHLGSLGTQIHRRYHCIRVHISVNKPTILELNTFCSDGLVPVFYCCRINRLSLLDFPAASHPNLQHQQYHTLLAELGMFSKLWKCDDSGDLIQVLLWLSVPWPKG